MFLVIFLDGTSCRLDFGLPSPLRSPVEGDVSGAKHVLAGAFQQPRALPAEGIELPTVFWVIWWAVYVVKHGDISNTSRHPTLPPTAKRSQYHFYPPLPGISDPMSCPWCLYVSTWIALEPGSALTRSPLKSLSINLLFNCPEPVVTPLQRFVK